MKAIVFLSLVILGAFILLGRMSGDLEKFREQVENIE